jgi:hypothetical protein
MSGKLTEEEELAKFVEEFFAAEKGAPFEPGDIVRYNQCYLTSLPIEEAKKLTVRWGRVLASTEESTVVLGFTTPGFEYECKTGRLEKIGKE